MAIGLDEGVSDADADERDGGAHDEDPRDAVRAHGGDRAEGVGAQQRAQLAEWGMKCLCICVSEWSLSFCLCVLAEAPRRVRF